MNSMMIRRRGGAAHPTLHPILAVGAVTVLCAAVLLLLAAPATAQPAIEFDASIAGQSVLDGDRLTLDPGTEPTMQLTVTNNTGREIGIRAVRLIGSVLGATFYSYDTAIGMELEPGETEEREFTLDLFALKGQATGLIPSSIELIDLERETLVAHEFVADVRGSLRSTYGYFGLGIAFLTLVGLFNAIKNLVTGELSESRWARAGTFALPGTGLGLALVFTLSALRVFVPNNESAGSITALLVAAFFVFGYLTPNPEEDEGQEDKSIRLEAKPPAPPRQRQGVGPRQS